jgi:uncharacterized protein (TIGR03435 family)
MEGIRMLRPAVLLLFASSALGQSFEAASIKPFPPDTPIQMSGCMGGQGGGDPARITCEYTTVKMLLMRAYQVKAQEIAGPAWLETEHFNIAAKLPEGATREQVSAMFRNLLAERFGVVVHREPRMLPGYALTVAPGGLKIKEAVPATAPAAEEEPRRGPPPTGDDGFPILRPSVIASGPVTLFRNGRARLQGGAMTLKQLADSLAGQLDQVIVDETGLSGKYAMTLYWTPRIGEMGARPVTAAAPTGDASVPDADLYSAVKQQLGLVLVAKKIQRDTVVVDKAEKVPTAN